LSPLAEIIALETRKHGVISFARFMELALCCPVYGYYEKEGDTVGRRGDFITSVSIGSLFGELLAFQFSEWLDELRGADCGMRIVEAGAHDGHLARDLLTWLRERRAGLFREIEYWIVEPSARRRERLEKALLEFGDSIRWATQLSDLADPPRPGGVGGIIFCNELLDAMPVHRLGWDAENRAWFEWGVTERDGRFVWTRVPNPAFSVSHPALPPSLADVLPDGFTTEICPAAQDWWRQAATSLRAGKLLTIDYGLAGEDFFMPERNEGTLRAYDRHRLISDVLANPGEQDITAHVNFTAIQSAGESAGLRTEQWVGQPAFLTRIAERAWRRPDTFGEWTPARTRQFQTLTHPEHLGRSFRVLVQSRLPSAELR
jgi:SAM-dependent MidA family methyltransferase